jgi:hypothetical protein
MYAPFVSLVRRGLSVTVRGQERRQRRQQLLGSLLGDPETEPGPSGADCGAEDELMRVSFHNLTAFGLGDAAKPARLAGRPLSPGTAS